MKSALMDNGLRNILRQVPPSSVLWYPGLDYDNWYTGTILDYSGQSPPNNGTITGAVTKRLPSGFYYLDFDGDDDYVERTIADWRSTDSAGTICLWFKTSAALSKALFSSCDEATLTSRLTFSTYLSGARLGLIQQNANDVSDVVYGNTVINDNAWHMATVVSSGTAWALYVDKTLQSLTGDGGSNTGDWFADTTLRDNFVIGNTHNSAGYGSDFSGSIALVRVLTEQLTVAQVAGYYQREHQYFGV